MSEEKHTPRQGTIDLMITETMVDRALNAWFASPPSETDRGLERSMRAALEAALSSAWEIKMDRNEIIEECAKCVPTNWLDPLLTGPNRVVRAHVDGESIERLLFAIRERITALKTAQHEGE